MRNSYGLLSFIAIGCCNPLLAEMATETDFQTAADKVKKLKAKPTDTELLELYGLFKQATVGDNTTSKPWVDLKGRAKWDAWDKKKGMEKTEAMEAYIEEANKLIEKYGLEVGCCPEELSIEVTKETFERDVERMKPYQERLTEAESLELFGWYMQGRKGDNNKKQPAEDAPNRKKFDAWMEKIGMRPVDAMDKYIDYARMLIAKYEKEDKQKH